MKKRIAAALMLAMLLSLTACGNTDTAADSGTAPAAEKAETVTSEAEEVRQQETELSGTVKAVDGSVVTITTEDGSEKSFTIMDETEYSLEMGEMPSGGNGGQNSTPPEMPSGDFGGQGGTPPEMPSGDFGGQGGTRPEMPSGGNGGQNSTPPEMPSGGNGGQGEMPFEMPNDGNGMQPGADMLTAGTEITVTVSANGTAEKIVIKLGGMSSEGFGGNAEMNYTSANTYSEDTSISGQSFTSTGKDENAILVTGGVVALDGSVIERVSSDSTGGDNASFYGVGAAALTTGGTLRIADSTIETDSAGGTGVFAYGDGTAYVSDTTITTKQNTSGGIHVAGGGTMYAWDLDVETSGESAAAIRSDRGSGTMVVDGGSYTSNGIGSPAIYSTADISVNHAELTANSSEAICIEGKNSIRLYDCTLSGNMSDDSRNDCTWNVILYQSMSGDSAVGNSLFEMVGGTLTAQNGGVFYTTNTESTFVLSGVDIVNAPDCEFLLKCTGNSNERGWGSKGANGAQCTFSAIGQTMTGDVIWDSISTLDFYMTEGSALTGAFLNDESGAGSGGDGYAALHIAEESTWIVTKDSTLSALALSGSIVDENGLTVSVVGTDGTVYVRGGSGITVTVESFSDCADLSGCGTVSSFADYAVERP